MKVEFIYANGTAYAIDVLAFGYALDMSFTKIVKSYDATPSASYMTLAGIDGKTVTWDGAVHTDPFPSMLDPNIFNTTKIVYPASFFPMGQSIENGASQVIAKITSLPKGTPFCLGGYSQGAAVMSRAYQQGLAPGTTGALESRRADFLGAVTFGNPCREINHRGTVGGTWSGSMGTSGSSTGGHGSFPSWGQWKRNTNSESKWVDFVAPNDIFTSIGGTSQETLWTEGNDALLNLVGTVNTGFLLTEAAAAVVSGGAITGPHLSAIGYYFGQGGVMNNLIDALGNPYKIGGYGHTYYPFLPPPDSSGNVPHATQTINGETYLAPVGDTAYQVALKYLTSLANASATAPIVVPPSGTTAGWSTTLIPPAA